MLWAHARGAHSVRILIRVWNLASGGLFGILGGSSCLRAARERWSSPRRGARWVRVFAAVRSLPSRTDFASESSSDGATCSGQNSGTRAWDTAAKRRPETELILLPPARKQSQLAFRTRLSGPTGPPAAVPTAVHSAATVASADSKARAGLKRGLRRPTVNRSARTSMGFVPALGDWAGGACSHHVTPTRPAATTHGHEAFDPSEFYSFRFTIKLDGPVHLNKAVAKIIEEETAQSSKLEEEVVM